MSGTATTAGIIDATKACQNGISGNLLFTFRFRRVGPRVSRTGPRNARTALLCQHGRVDGGKVNERRHRSRPARRPARGRSDAGASGDASGGEQLTEYRRRRDFSRTAEPKGREPADDSAPRFVVQIHDASSLHFDFRLESDGVLKSWAVPRGPSTDPGDKRLAVPTEDHPLDYRDFEGVIAEGEYGAGTVIIWDEGHWAFEGRGSAAEGLAGGHLSFRLDGHKLRGGWALTRFRRNAWLLVKRDDRYANDHGTPDPTRARSARTDRTLRQTAAQAAHATDTDGGDETDADPS
ncbi:hypothetical protein FH609_013835 [Streptomyces sp. 3MP-14]|uniref:DNA ligase D 3'-phosphoesterase domain-containing protein n=2 Tax=Streptomyces TaxID=1883 RepID=A0A5N6A9U8_9ACTN|nr:hypothetical protein FH607_016725 [Streptomyces mimosae]KAB8176555.1 hypothetical protein FH609_013835 [Streptomyces sp. 3MP-14]